jgi:hypothetical protein
MLLSRSSQVPELLKEWLEKMASLIGGITGCRCEVKW